VVCFEHSFELQQIFMLQISENFNLILETVKFLRTVLKNLLGEDLCSEALAVLQLDHLVDRG
jgi:membrane protein CcdC involved in cytochrome C biogenesis